MVAAESIHQLLKCGAAVLKSAKSGSLEAFEESLRTYLEKFSNWQNDFEQQDQAAIDPAIVTKLVELQAMHQKILSEAGSKKDQVLVALSDIHKRGKALKAYLDRYPSRITITGKREG